jgi:basic membrane protein A
MVRIVMHGKNFSTLISLLIIGFVLASCSAATPDKTDCTREDVFCVGLVTGLEGIKDQSLNQDAWEGVLQAQDEKVADQIRYIETVDAKDYPANISTLAEAGYDMIITTGNENRDATIQAARNYTDTLFIGVDQNQEQILPNLAGLVFHDDQLGFLAGALAAQVTRSNTIAVVLDAATSISTALEEGYEAGARYIHADINIISAYYPGEAEAAYTGPRWGAISAGDAIQRGADVIFAAGGNVGKGVLLETIKHKGLYCVGVNNDLWNMFNEAHPCLISSAVKQIPSGVYQLVGLGKQSAFQNGNYYGTTGMASYHDFVNIIPQTVIDEMNSLTAGLEAGTISTGINRED